MASSNSKPSTTCSPKKATDSFAPRLGVQLTVALLMGAALGVATLFATPTPALAANEVTEEEVLVKNPFEPSPLYERFEDHELCTSGRFQSPIDITDAVPINMKPLNFSYYPMDKVLVDYDGRHLRLIHDRGSAVAVGSRLMELREVRFHAPSEHTFKGKNHDMELEFVHRSSKGKTVLISVIAKAGKHNHAFDDILAAIPRWIGGERMLIKNFSVEELMPKSRKYYKYTGSLTIAPCTEGISWYILKSPVEFSTRQIETFKKAIDPNNRPIQPTNGRKVRSLQ